MKKVIIYKEDNDVLAVLSPTEDALEMFGINEVAKRDVPSGKRYRIIDASELPSDQSQRNAWTADEADLTDGVGGEK